MAKRIARRAHVNEQGVAVCFAFNNLFTALVLGTVEAVVQFVPVVGALLDLAFGLLGFYFHRIVLVTDDNVYVYRDLPFHIPGRLLASYQRGPGVVTIGSQYQNRFSRLIRRGELSFSDGFVVYHNILWIRRAQYIEQEANIPAGD